MTPLFTLVFIQVIIAWKIKLTDDRSKRTFYFILALAIIVIFQGFRDYSIGIDLDKKGGYLPFFQSLTVNDIIGPPAYKFETGFLLYSFVVKVIMNNFSFYLLITSLIIHTLILYTIYKESDNPVISIIMYLTLGLFTFTFSGLRQSIAIGILFFSLKYVKSKEPKKFILMIIIATSFHVSALVFLPAYNIFYLDSSGISKTKILTGLIVFTYVFRRKILMIFSSIFQSRPIVLENNASIRMVLILFFLWLITRLIIDNCQNLSKSRVILSITKLETVRKYIIGYSNFIYIALVFQVFAKEFTGFSRMGYYYYIFSVLLVPFVLSLIQNKRIRNYLTIILIIGSLIYFTYHTGSGYLNVFPFKFRVQ